MKSMTPERVMRFEKAWPVRNVAEAQQKAIAIYQTFGVPQSVYYEELAELVGTVVFTALDPAEAEKIAARQPEVLTADAAMELEARFQNHSPRRAGEKASEITRRFGLSLTMYTQVLNQMIDDPAVIERHPMRTRMLREARHARKRAGISSQPEQRLASA